MNIFGPVLAILFTEIFTGHQFLSEGMLPSVLTHFLWVLFKQNTPGILLGPGCAIVGLTCELMGVGTTMGDPFKVDPPGASVFDSTSSCRRSVSGLDMLSHFCSSSGALSLPA